MNTAPIADQCPGDQVKDIDAISLTMVDVGFLFFPQPGSTVAGRGRRGREAVRNGDGADGGSSF